jgi:hypothetical protein
MARKNKLLGQHHLTTFEPNYLQRVGLEFDIAVNVATGGQLGETVSLRSAIADGWEAGAGGNPVQSGPRKAWGCVMCGFLNRFVQKNHCRDQFVNGPTPNTVMIRAGIAFALGFGCLYAVIHLLVHSL